MLEITIAELEDLRVKLLAGVITGHVPDDMTALALLLAKDLDGLVALMQGNGVTCVPVDSSEFGHILQGVVDEQQASSAN